MGRLTGKIAIVTGAARGMGEAEARLFVAEGARVMVADVLDPEVKVVAESLGDHAIGVHLDVTDEHSWVEALRACRSRWGDPHVLVNNAGILQVGPLLTLEADDMRRVLEVNVIGPFLGLKVVGGAMAEDGRGSIINVSSTGGMIGMSMLTAYTASKWAVRGMTKSAAIELAKRGVRVSSLHPGGVATPMSGAADSVLTEPPALGAIDPDAALAALDESSYCTGGEFVADGGDIAGHNLTASFG